MRHDLKLQRLVPALVLALGSAASHADTTVFSEGFDSFSALATNGWVFVNQSAAPLGNNWFAGNTGIFSAADGAAGSYVAANFQSTQANTGAINNWLITPQIGVANGYTLNFKVRAGGADFLDSLQILLSPTGGSATTDFTTLLGSYSSSTDEGWVTKTFTIAGLAAPANARIGFLYTIGDVASDGNYLGLDTVSVTVVPEPAPALLLALGLAGLVIRRRLAA
jgi:hypothetical protein